MPVKIRSINPLCVPRCSSQAVITRDLVNGGNMQSDRRFFFLRLRCLSHWQHGSVLQEQPPYSHSLSQPFLHSAIYWQPTLRAQSPRHLAERHLLLRTLLNQSLTSLGFKGPIIPFFYMVYLFEMLVSHRSETSCHIGFVSFHFFSHWHLYLMGVY